MPEYWYVAIVLFSHIFLLDGEGDRREEKFLSIFEWQETVDVFLTLLAPNIILSSFPTSLYLGQNKLPIRHVRPHSQAQFRAPETQYQKLQGPWGKGPHLHSLIQ